MKRCRSAIRLTAAHCCTARLHTPPPFTAAYGFTPPVALAVNESSLHRPACRCENQVHVLGCSSRYGALNGSFLEPQQPAAITLAVLVRDVVFMRLPI
jgi:hypothetical protein